MCCLFQSCFVVCVRCLTLSCLALSVPRLVRLVLCVLSYSILPLSLPGCGRLCLFFCLCLGLSLPLSLLSSRDKTRQDTYTLRQDKTWQHGWGWGKGWGWGWRWWWWWRWGEGRRTKEEGWRDRWGEGETKFLFQHQKYNDWSDVSRWSDIRYDEMRENLLLAAATRWVFLAL